MNQLTVGGFDGELSASVRHLAKQGGISLNRATLKLLRRALGPGVAPHPRVPSSARPAGAELELPRPGAKMSPGSTEPL